MKKREWRCPENIYQQIQKGKRGNGCGAAGTPSLIVKCLTFGFGFNFKKECDTHDLIYSQIEKSFDGKANADTDFEFNLALNIKNHKPDSTRQWLIDHVSPYRWAYNNYKDHLPRYYHAAVTAGGYDAYWQNKNKTK